MAETKTRVENTRAEDASQTQIRSDGQALDFLDLLREGRNHRLNPSQGSYPRRGLEHDGLVPVESQPLVVDASEKFSVTTTRLVNPRPFAPSSGYTDKQTLQTSIETETTKLEHFTSWSTLGLDLFGPLEQAARPGGIFGVLRMPEKDRNRYLNAAIAGMSQQERLNLTSDLANYHSQLTQFYNGPDRLQKMLVNSFSPGPEMPPSVKDFYGRVKTQVRNDIGFRLRLDTPFIRHRFDFTPYVDAVGLNLRAALSHVFGH